MGWIKNPLGAADSFQITSTVTNPQYFVDGITTGVSATPALIEDEMVDTGI